MRNKIRMSFDELPQSAHTSLRDSLITHIEHITMSTNAIITKQLCLALANLILLMAEWPEPVQCLLKKFATKSESIEPLLITLTFIPEEMDDRHLRLGDNRRKQIQKELEMSSPTLLNFLNECMMITDRTVVQRLQFSIMKCFTSWVKMNCIPTSEVANSAVFLYAFQILGHTGSETNQMDTASDCICAVLESMNMEHLQPELEKQLFTGIMGLKQAYKDAMDHEDNDKAMVLCRIFTVLAETFLQRMIHQSTPTAPHYSMESLDMLITCVGHFDFEIAQITFNVWYKLSEDLYDKNDDTITILFKSYIERLIEALYKHCQLDSDHEGLFDDEDSFSEFRYKVSELIKDVVFIVSSITVFRHMFRILQLPNISWESTEAALFIMECIARNIDTEETEVVPNVVQAILNLPENCHITIRYTSVNILGQLCDWIAVHQSTLGAILNFLLAALQKKAALASAAAHSLQLICTSSHEVMINHITGLVEIARSLETYEIQPEAAATLLKGISTTVSRLSNDQIPEVMRQLCSFQISHLVMLMNSGDRVKDPIPWLDRLASIYRHMNPKFGPNEAHPGAVVIMENWPVLSRTMSHYHNDSKIMERIVRTIRYAIRCIQHQAMPILESLVNQMVETYKVHKQSCLLYMGSILVDEFGSDMRCIAGLLGMLQAFIEPTFNILQATNGLKDHPDTVDDFFRLAGRFIQRSPLQFLQSSIVAPIIQCATLACTLDHRDANMSVMKFLSNLLAHGKQNADTEIRPFVLQIVQIHGETLVCNLLCASIFYLHSHMLPDVTDVFMEMKFIASDVFADALKNALTQLPRKNSGGSVTATDEQMNEFYQSVTK